MALLLLTVVTLMASGCLIPQDPPAGSNTALPAMINLPPAIVGSDPPDRVTFFTVGSGTADCPDVPAVFKATVLDLNGIIDGGADDLETEWLLDDDRDNPLHGQTYPGVPGAQEVVSPSILTTKLESQQAGTRHFVEVLVTDGHFIADAGVDGLPAIGKVTPFKGKDSAYVASFAWWVQIATRICP